MKKMLPVLVSTIVLVVCGLLYFNLGNKAPAQEVLKVEKNGLVNEDLFGDYYKEALTKLKTMTLEEKVGQLFLVRYHSDVDDEISHLNPGGYILFARDFEKETKDSIREKLAFNQENSKIPLILGVDEEGGIVNRVSRFKSFRSEPFLSPQDLNAKGGMNLILETETEKDKLLLALGINYVLAPVADVSTNEDDFIYNRTFGKNSKETADYVGQVVKTANKNDISTCLKHFPGYGDNIDTHTGIAVDERPLTRFEEEDFVPFEAGIKEKVPTILFSHNIVKSMDETLPASLSKSVHLKLRKDLGYSGIILTDDLAMDAVGEYVKSGEVATLAVNSLNDMIITSDFETHYNEVLKSVHDGKVDIKTIDTAVERVLAWKYAYGIIK